LRPWLSGRLLHKWSIKNTLVWIKVVPFCLAFYDWCWHLYFLCLLSKISLAEDFWKLFSSPQRTMLMLFSVSLRLWHMHAVIQMSPNGVLGSRNCCCLVAFPLRWQPALLVQCDCTLQVPDLSVLTSGFSSFTAQPTWRHLASAGCIMPIFVSWLAVGVIPASPDPDVSFIFVEFVCRLNAFLAQTLLHPVLAWNVPPMCRHEGGCMLPFRYVSFAHILFRRAVNLLQFGWINKDCSNKAW